jgi:hypothetical protein
MSSCFQCDLDIPHVCYAGVPMPNARWGMTDEAIAVLEGAQRHGYMLTSKPVPAPSRAAPTATRHRGQRSTPKKRRTP